MEECHFLVQQENGHNVAENIEIHTVDKFYPDYSLSNASIDSLSNTSIDSQKKDKLYPDYLEFIETCRLQKLPKAHAPGQTLVFSATT
jgi:hypothetical protein